jgi:hypothetical protein
MPGLPEPPCPPTEERRSPSQGDTCRTSPGSQHEVKCWSQAVSANAVPLLQNTKGTGHQDSGWADLPQPRLCASAVLRNFGRQQIGTHPGPSSFEKVSMRRTRPSVSIDKRVGGSWRPGCWEASGRAPWGYCRYRAGHYTSATQRNHAIILT